MSKIIEHPLKPDIFLFFTPPEYNRIFGENFDYDIGNHKKILERISTVVEDPSFVSSIDKNRAPQLAVSLAHTACNFIERNLNWEWCDLEFVDSQFTVVHALVSPDRKYVLDAVSPIYGFLTARRKSLKLSLTVNMILGGQLPPSHDGEYTMLTC